MLIPNGLRHLLCGYVRKVCYHALAQRIEGFTNIKLVAAGSFNRISHILWFTWDKLPGMVFSTIQVAMDITRSVQKVTISAIYIRVVAWLHGQGFLSIDQNVPKGFGSGVAGELKALWVGWYVVMVKRRVSSVSAGADHWFIGFQEVWPNVISCSVHSRVEEWRGVTPSEKMVPKRFAVHCEIAFSGADAPNAQILAVR